MKSDKRKKEKELAKKRRFKELERHGGAEPEAPKPDHCLNKNSPRSVYDCATMLPCSACAEATP